MRLSSTSLLSFLGLAGLLTACGSGGGSSASNVDNGSTIAGSISALAPQLEAEPNGTVDTAQNLGDLNPGGSVTVLGSLDAGGDEADVFLVNLTERAQVLFSLQYPSEEGQTDFDVELIDPVTDQVVEQFQGSAAPEEGIFFSRGATLLSIRPVSGAGTYTLTIDAGLGLETFEDSEPNDVITDGQYTGELSAGQAWDAEGRVSAVGDVDDFYLIAIPEALTLDLDLSFVATNGIDLDLGVWIATGGLANAMEDFTFEQPTLGSETGQVMIPAMSLVGIKVRAFAGIAVDYELEIASTAALTGAGGGFGPAPVSSVRLTSLDDGYDYARPRHTNQIPGEVILHPRAGQDLTELMARRGLEPLERMPNGTILARFPMPVGFEPLDQSRRTLAMARTLASCQEVAWAEPNLWRQATALQGAGNALPNDPFFPLQWHYEKIGLPAAWDLTQGDNAVIVAVLDTGETPHPDMTARQIQGFDMISNAQNAGDGNGFDTDPFDVGDNIDGETPGASSYHGTHVAGTVGATTNNGTGVAGVTWFTRIMHVRVLGLQGGSSFDIANGILWAAGLDNASGNLPVDPADIINMSLGGPGQDAVTQNAITDARNAGSVIIAAAGNNNSPEPFFPAAYDGVISVSAVDFNGDKAPYSNFHATVDIAAPGGNVAADANGDGNPDGVLSPLFDDTKNPAEPVYGFYQGTSMAAPHVAGVAALMLAVDPMLTVQQVENILTGTAIDRGDPGRDDIFGFGLVNAFAAVQQAQNGAPTDPVLVLGSNLAGFDTSESERIVSIQNGGTDGLQVTLITATTNNGGNWLSADGIDSNSAATDTSGVVITVDRSGLADGTYTGQVDVESNGGSGTIEVTMQVGVGGEADIDIFVLVIDTETFATVAEEVVNLGGDRDFFFTNLPPGQFYVVAGSDINEDGFICDDGEPYCGFYPSLDLIEALTIEEGVSFEDIDFPVQSVFLNQGASTQNERPVFQRL